MIATQTFNPLNLKQPDRMGMMIIVAIAFHAVVILGVTFAGPDIPEESKISPRIEVTLVTTRSDIEPDEADYLAQANQEGGGNTTEKIRPETLFVPVIPKESLSVTTPTPPTQMVQPKEERANKRKLMAQDSGRDKIIADDTSKKRADTKSKSAAQMMSQSRDIASLEVELGESMRAYSKMPRKKYITAQTKEYKYASYMENWRLKIEKIGNLNFPEEARRRQLSGSLLLDVEINGDGTIRTIKVSRSSGHKLLDDAALRIVHLAAPFAALSAAILEETDVLHITRTWQFLGGGLQTSQ